MVEIINIEIYCTSVCFCIGIDEKAFDELYKDNKDKFDDELYKECYNDITDENACDGFTSTMKDGSYMVYIRKGYENNYRIVIHELFHLTNRILCDRGVYHEITAEAWAYLIGWLSEQYFNIINKDNSFKIKAV